MAVAWPVAFREPGRPGRPCAQPGPELEPITDVAAEVARLRIISWEAISLNRCNRCGSKLWPGYSRYEVSCCACGAMFYRDEDWRG